MNFTKLFRFLVRIHNRFNLPLKLFNLFSLVNPIQHQSLLFLKHVLIFYPSMVECSVHGSMRYMRFFLVVSSLILSSRSLIFHSLILTKPLHPYQLFGIFPSRSRENLLMELGSLTIKRRFVKKGNMKPKPLQEKQKEKNLTLKLLSWTQHTSYLTTMNQKKIGR